MTDREKAEAALHDRAEILIQDNLSSAEWVDGRLMVTFEKQALADIIAAEFAEGPSSEIDESERFELLLQEFEDTQEETYHLNRKRSLAKFLSDRLGDFIWNEIKRGLVIVQQGEAPVVRENTLREAARLVCMYCAGHCPPYHREVEGPNSAGNYIHQSKKDGTYRGELSALCVASSLYSKIRYDAALEANK